MCTHVYGHQCGIKGTIESKFIVTLPDLCWCRVELYFQQYREGNDCAVAGIIISTQQPQYVNNNMLTGSNQPTYYSYTINIANLWKNQDHKHLNSQSA